jgi:oligoendopeptidase F
VIALVLALSIDFTRVFPPIEKQQADFSATMTRVESYRGRAARKPIDAIEAYNAALAAYERLDAFLYLTASIDTTDVKSRDDEQTLTADFERRTAFLFDELRNVAPKKLGRYAYFVATQPRVPREKEELLASLQPFTTGWQSDLAAQTDNRDLRAFALIKLVRAGNTIAKMRGYEDAGAQIYARSGLTKAEIKSLLDDVAAHADIYRRYQELRASHAPGVSPRYALEDARPILTRAAAPLGAKYVSELSKLLDPAAGRFDSGPGDHRRRGGFSKGFPGFPSVFYMQTFAGAYNDLRVIAHEGTHAVQRQLEADRKVPPVYIDGPKFLAEAYAMLNELLLPEMLANEATDAAQKQFFLEQFLDSKGLAVIFRTAAEAALEQAIYENESIRTAADLDALTANVAVRFAVPKLDWPAVRLMFDDPFYDVNYTLAGLVALRMYARWKADPAFMTKYAELLAHGYSAPPAELLRSYAGIDIRDRALVAKALEAVQPKLDELSAVYRSHP